MILPGLIRPGESGGPTFPKLVSYTSARGASGSSINLPPNGQVGDLVLLFIAVRRTSAVTLGDVSGFTRAELFTSATDLRSASLDFRMSASDDPASVVIPTNQSTANIAAVAVRIRSQGNLNGEGFVNSAIQSNSSSNQHFAPITNFNFGPRPCFMMTAMFSSNSPATGLITPPNGTEDIFTNATGSTSSILPATNVSLRRLVTDGAEAPGNWVVGGAGIENPNLLTLFVSG